MDHLTTVQVSSHFMWHLDLGYLNLNPTCKLKIIEHLYWIRKWDHVFCWILVLVRSMSYKTTPIHNEAFSGKDSRFWIGMDDLDCESTIKKNVKDISDNKKLRICNCLV